MRAYWIDRSRTLRGTELVVALNVRGRGVRTRAVLADGSLYDTQTRTCTFVRVIGEGITRYEGVAWPSEQKNPRP